MIVMTLRPAMVEEDLVDFLGSARRKLGEHVWKKEDQARFGSSIGDVVVQNKS